MLRCAPLLIVALMFAAPPIGAAAETLDAPARQPPSSDRAVRPALPKNTAETLDTDFAALAAARSPAEAKRLEQRILAEFNRSGSDTADLFMNWATEALGRNQHALALDLLDQVIVLKPGFAEAYNRRATVYYMLDDYTRSLADIRTTLALEPRHFGALSGLGAIMKEIGETDRAIEVYRRLLEVNPKMESARTTLEALEAGTEGSPI